MIAGLAGLERRPVLAGICFGLLTIKPQLGVLIPVMLVLTGQWRAILAAAWIVAALMVATGLLFGFDIWPEYFRQVMPLQSQILTAGQGIFTIMMPTVFMNARIAHLSLDIAWALQIATSIAAVAAVVSTYWRRRDPVLSAALLVTASFLVTPYAFNYDMVVFSWVIALLREKGGARLDDRLALAVWTLPVTAMVIGLFAIPGSALVLVAVSWRLVWRLKAGGTRPGKSRPRRRLRGRGYLDVKVCYSPRGPMPSRTARKRGNSFVHTSARATPTMRTKAPGPNRTHCTIFIGFGLQSWPRPAAHGSAACRRRAAACRR